MRSVVYTRKMQRVNLAEQSDDVQMFRPAPPEVHACRKHLLFQRRYTHVIILSYYRAVFPAHACVACSAVAVSTLPDDLAFCDGPYRLQDSNSEEGIFAWSHVSDERCTLLHDRAGNSFVSVGNHATPLTASSVTAMAHVAPLSKEWWDEVLLEAGTLASLGQEANVMCTSAGHTTRLVFDLVETMIPEQKIRDAAIGFTSHRPGFQLTSRQYGSIVSSSCSLVHLQVSRKAEGDDPINIGGADLQVPETGAHDADRGRELDIKVSVDGVVATSSLDSASFEGFAIQLDGRAGTHVIEVCLLQRHPGENQPDGRKGCVADTAFLLEVFSADTHIFQRRDIMLPSSAMAGGMDASKDDLQVIRVVFMIDLEVVDGYKLSTLHLMKHLPRNFRASMLDVTCACENQCYADVCVVALQAYVATYSRQRGQKKVETVCVFALMPAGTLVHTWL